MDVDLPAEKVGFSVYSPAEVRDLKQQLLNTVAAALINEPRPSVTNPAFVRITTLCKKIAFYDPEFVLKLAVCSIFIASSSISRSSPNFFFFFFDR